MVARGALILLVLVAPWLVRPSSSGDGRAERLPHERIDLPSVVACGECHLDVTREWSESLHARAWTNANVRRATRDFERESCRPCHSPRSVFETGFESAPGFREENREDGVHCLSCHGLADGVAARRTIADAPCRPRAEPRLAAAEHCLPCHEPTHGAFEEYRRSRAFAEGVRCADCHMPPRPDGSGRSHGPHGGMSPELVRTAIAWEARRDAAGVEVEVTNRTGHRFPGEIPSRSFRIVCESEGQEARNVLLRKPHRDEEREDDRLEPDETRLFRFPCAPEARVEVRLSFAPLPLLSEAESIPLGSFRSERHEGP